jgi:hypothetical protein
MQANKTTFFSVVPQLALFQGNLSLIFPCVCVDAGGYAAFARTNAFSSYRASSVLQRNVKVYGPMNALITSDGSSCWNSDSCDANKQHQLLIDFKRSVLIQELRLQFQAGFVAETIHLKLQKQPDNKWVDFSQLQADDTLEMQTFPLNCQETSALKLVFDEFTDFYGRITIYQVQVWGKDVSL